VFEDFVFQPAQLCRRKTQRRGKLLVANHAVDLRFLSRSAGPARAECSSACASSLILVVWYSRLYETFGNGKYSRSPIKDKKLVLFYTLVSKKKAE
jgi:hypothetical protein